LQHEKYTVKKRNILLKLRFRYDLLPHINSLGNRNVGALAFNLERRYELSRPPHHSVTLALENQPLNLAVIDETFRHFVL
jgi:hypothetical protein